MAGNEVTVTVSGGTTTTVTVPGSTGTPAPTITNGGTANVTVTSVGERGPQGEPGPASTELRSTATHLQWRAIGGSDWTNLVALAAITGPQGATGSFAAAQEINPQTADYTLAIADSGRLITVASGSQVTITIPAGGSVAFPVGTHIDIARIGVGAVVIAGASGVTVNGALGLKLRDRYSAATLIEVAADSWIAVGDLSQ
jgi:hypothetical protein